MDNFSVTITAAPTIDTGNGLAANADFPIGVALAADGNASIFTSVPRQNIVKANFDEIVVAFFDEIVVVAVAISVKQFLFHIVVVVVAVFG